MKHTPWRYLRLLVVIAYILAFFLSSRQESHSAPALSQSVEQLAKQVILHNKCGNCHALQAKGLNFSGTIGPNLTHQGQRGRSASWLKTKLLNPSSFTDLEVVPGFEGKQKLMPKLDRISSRELNSLVAFLRSLH